MTKMLRIPLKITMISFIPSLSIKSGERGGLRRGERERKRELALFLLQLDLLLILKNLKKGCFLIRVKVKEKKLTLEVSSLNLSECLSDDRIWHKYTFVKNLFKYIYTSKTF